MKVSNVPKIAKFLKVLVTLVFIVNLLILLLIPAVISLGADDLLGGVGSFIYRLVRPGEDDIVAAGVMGIFMAWFWVWTDLSNALGCLFLLLSGICTATILWQGRRVLDTILQGAPFSLSNAVSLRRAAISSFLIAGAALVRLVAGMCSYQSLRPLASYNALFIPIFFMAGLLCLVMSALFRQAAELKAENDLMI